MSAHGDQTTLDVTDNKLIFARAGTILFQCGYDAKSYSPGIGLWLMDSKSAQVMSGWPSRPFDWLIYYRISGRQLELWGGPDFLPFLFDRMKPLDPPIDDTVRFIRLVE